MGEPGRPGLLVGDLSHFSPMTHKTEPYYTWLRIFLFLDILYRYAHDKCIMIYVHP